MKELAVVLPEPADYKDDLPLPNFSQQPTAAQPALRGDQDPLRADDWAKQDSMVGAAQGKPKLKESTVFRTLLALSLYRRCLWNLFPYNI